MMMNQYDQLELHTFLEARKLAAAGEEFAFMLPQLGPDKAMRLRVFVQGLPDAIREMTIYGKAAAKTPTKSSKKK